MTTVTISEGTATTWSVSTITARTIITDAMREINAIGQGESVSSNDANWGLSKLNRLLEQWWIDQKFIHYKEIVSYAWTTSATSYTIGPTGDFVGDRPVLIERANLVRVSTDPDEHVPINVYTATDYFRIPYPATAAEEPECIWYQATATNGIIYPYPYPENTAAALANKLELLIWTQLNKFTDLDTAVSLVPGYESALILTLAEDLCSSFQIEPSNSLIRKAGRARELLTSQNITSTKPEYQDSGLPIAEAW